MANPMSRNPLSPSFNRWQLPMRPDPYNAGGTIIDPGSPAYKAARANPEYQTSLRNAAAFGGGGGGMAGGGGDITVKREGANEFAMERDRYGLQQRLGRLEDKNMKDQIMAEGKGVMQGGKAGKLAGYANQMMANQRNMRKTREELMRMDQDPEYATNRLFGKYGIGRAS